MSWWITIQNKYLKRYLTSSAITPYGITTIEAEIFFQKYDIGLKFASCCVNQHFRKFLSRPVPKQLKSQILLIAMGFIFERPRNKRADKFSFLLNQISIKIEARF